MAASAWTTTLPGALDVLSDERLARLAGRGDTRAFDALFSRYRAALTRYCRTVLRHEADAEDAAQNALLAAHRALQGGTVPMRVRPWLYRIAHNEAVSLARTRRPAEELDEAALPAVADAAEAGEVRRRLGELMSDLRCLTERQREALVLRELSGLSYAEIGQALASSEAAAQQVVFEARSALQQFGEGRALACEGVQRAMSECDGMRLRTRRLRAHLRDCEHCRGFEAALRTRRRDLGLLFPPTGAGGVLAALGRLLGGNGEAVLAGLGAKGAAIGLAVLAGGGAVVATSAGGDRPAPPPAVALPASAVPASAPSGERPGAVRPAAGERPRAGAPTREEAKRARRPGRRGAAVTADGDRVAPAVSGNSGSGGQSGAPLVASGPSPSGGSGGSGGSGPRGISAPAVRAPAGTPAPVADVVDGAGDTVRDATGTVTQAVQDAAPVIGAVQDLADTLTGTTGGAVPGVTDALP